MIWVRKIHKWIGLILGLQLVLWMASGLVMGLLPHDLVQGSNYRKTSTPPPPLGTLKHIKAADLNNTVQRQELFTLLGQATVKIQTGAGIELRSAQTGQPIIIDDTMAEKLANADYSGPGKISSTTKLQAPFLELRKHEGPVWRVDIADGQSTSLYVSAEDGRILERRNTYWRVFDFFWMLHTMDYSGRDNFNNYLVISVALIVLWLGVTGLILWFDSFRRDDFAFIRRWRSRSLHYSIDIRDSDAGAHEKIRLKPLQTLFEGMASGGHPLPSSCGGGGTCGLCRVRIEPAPPVSAADRRAIPESEQKQGYRLACQHRLNRDLTITLPHGLLGAKTCRATIIASDFLTPFICQIRLKLAGEDMFDFRAGSYIQVTIPPFKNTLTALNVPDSVRQFWFDSHTPTTFGTEKPLFRTYSLANAPGELKNELLLNVRLAMPQPDRQNVPVGIGSAYLTGLNPGDCIDIKGPFGDFHIRNSEQKLVFIGGGAGMAPLRSMIRDELLGKKSNAPMSFWYGARTPNDLLYKEEFDALQSQHSNFKWHYAFSEDSHQADSSQQGFIHKIVRKQFQEYHADMKDCAFYICGPPPMLKAILELLAELNVSPEQIAFDDFGS